MSASESSGKPKRRLSAERKPPEKPRELEKNKRDNELGLSARLRLQLKLKDVA